MNPIKVTDLLQNNKSYDCYWSSTSLLITHNNHLIAVHCPTITQFIPIEKCVQYRMMHDACTPLVRAVLLQCMIN